jgi:hypothetical protein
MERTGNNLQGRTVRDFTGKHTGLLRQRRVYPECANCFVKIRKVAIFNKQINKEWTADNDNKLGELSARPTKRPTKFTPKS